MVLKFSVLKRMPMRLELIPNSLGWYVVMTPETNALFSTVSKIKSEQLSGNTLKLSDSLLLENVQKESIKFVNASDELISLYIRHIKYTLTF